jgi:preprotein translocase subunit SecA
MMFRLPSTGLAKDVQQVLRLARGGQALPEAAALREGLLRRSLRHGTLAGPALHAACAAVDRAARHCLGREPYPTQWHAALALLGGRLAEMATGEGKTLAMGLAATVAALAGRQVHLITGNDYLVGRDAGQLQPLYAHFGLTAAAVLARSSPRARGVAYGQDVVYLTGRELMFDALRDRQAAGAADPLARSASALGGAAAPEALVRRFDMALIDEADSVLLDEAEVPFVLSRPAAPRWPQGLEPALHVARGLRPGVDFRLDADALNVRLTDEGRRRIEAGAPAGAWINALHRDETVVRALVALHALQPGRDYLVQEGAVTLVDGVTGRLAHGRQWSHGLHALVAMKEGCAPPPDTETVARSLYPLFLQRYRHVAGISGTLCDARGELRRLYGLRVVRVPRLHPCRRRMLAPRVFFSAAARWAAVVQRVCTLADQGRPVLIGTDSVADSQALAQCFQAAGRAVVVLNAAQDAREAEIVAQAGQPGRITVATNMAGRGTDIELSREALEAGGLHVLSCQANPSRRLDLQLAGRCARRGEPGSAETWLLWPVEREQAHGVRARAAQVAVAMAEYWRIPLWGVMWRARRRQRDAEIEAAQQRWRLVELHRVMDLRLGLAFDEGPGRSTR